VIPSVSQYAFGFRPIVIAYLHLVLLGFISLFLIGYFIQLGYLKISNRMRVGLLFFLLGILGNELVLMFQGLSFFGFWSPPHSNELLLVMAGMMFVGMFLINISNKNSY
jgi:fucose 4-O-acetylase-like acetyltransferase